MNTLSNEYLFFSVDVAVQRFTAIFISVYKSFSLRIFRFGLWCDYSCSFVFKWILHHLFLYYVYININTKRGPHFFSFCWSYARVSKPDKCIVIQCNLFSSYIIQWWKRPHKFHAIFDFFLFINRRILFFRQLFSARKLFKWIAEVQCPHFRSGKRRISFWVEPFWMQNKCH